MTTTENVKPPLCSRCGNRMSVAFVVPHKPGREPRTHKCPVCGNIETVEIAV
jgi:transposase